MLISIVSILFAVFAEYTTDDGNAYFHKYYVCHTTVIDIMFQVGENMSILVPMIGLVGLAKAAAGP